MHQHEQNRQLRPGTQPDEALKHRTNRNSGTDCVKGRKTASKPLTSLISLNCSGVICPERSASSCPCSASSVRNSVCQGRERGGGRGAGAPGDSYMHARPHMPTVPCARRAPQRAFDNASLTARKDRIVSGVCGFPMTPHCSMVSLRVWASSSSAPKDSASVFRPVGGAGEGRGAEET
jgi:hypothetical protein